MALVVLDPGHGGADVRGKSTPFGLNPPGGPAEKELTLDLASTVARGVGDAALTRSGDTNLSLRERRDLASGARALVSIHASETPSGATEVWVHPRANPASERLAANLAAALGGVTVRRDAEMAILHPDGLPSALGACLVEVAWGQAARADSRGRVGGQLAQGLREFLTLRETPTPMGSRLGRPAAPNDWHPGYEDGAPTGSGWSPDSSYSGAPAGRGGFTRPHGEGESYGRRNVRMGTRQAGSYPARGSVRAVAQPTDNTCWAASFSMLYYARNGQNGSIRGAVSTVGSQYETMFDADRGLPWRDYRNFATAAGLTVEVPQNYTAEGWIDLLTSVGPVWVERIPTGNPPFFGHASILVGVEYAGQDSGSQMVFIDPATGRNETVDFLTFVREYEQRFVEGNSTRTPDASTALVLHF